MLYATEHPSPLPLPLSLSMSMSMCRAATPRACLAASCWGGGKQTRLVSPRSAGFPGEVNQRFTPNVNDILLVRAGRTPFGSVQYVLVCTPCEPSGIRTGCPLRSQQSAGRSHFFDELLLLASYQRVAVLQRTKRHSASCLLTT